MQNPTQLGRLEIRLEEKPKLLRLVWLGEFDERDPAELLRGYAEEVARLAADSRRGVLIDLTGLAFMNSSGIGFMTRFVRSLAEQQIDVDVRYDTRVSWQDLSKRCMKTIFARLDHVRISDQGSQS